LLLFFLSFRHSLQLTTPYFCTFLRFSSYLSSLQQNASEGGGLSLGSSSIARAPQTRREREEELSRAHSTQQRPVREREREIEHSDEEEEGSAGVMDAAERERLREKAAFDIFNSIDDDGSGFLEPSELPFLLKTLGREVDELQLEGIMRELDDDGDGEISFEGAFLFIFFIHRMTEFLYNLISGY
jgi:hypothetical protein